MQGNLQLNQLQVIILSSEASLNSVQDNVSWNLAASGNFSVRSAYQGLKDEPRIKVLIHKVWKMKVPPKMKFFAFLIL